MNFDVDPWPSISGEAKDLVLSLLNVHADYRPSAQQILRHPWMRNAKHHAAKHIDSVVLQRLKRFAGSGKLKKAMMMVVASCLTPEEI